MKTKEAVKALSALAQESRLAVFRLLVRAGEEGMAAGDIAAHLGVPPATLSFHLKELTTANLLQQSRSGRNIVYALNTAAMRDLMDFLMEDCCQGRPELCQPSISKSVKRKTKLKS